MRTKWGWLVLLSALLIATPVVGAQGAPREEPGPPEAAERGRDFGDGGRPDPGLREQGFARFNPVMILLDTDKDGKLSAEEINKSSEILAKMDEDGDGYVTGQELWEAMPRPEGFKPRRGGERGPGRMRGPSEEDLPSIREIMQRLMEFDANGDGRLAREEVSSKMTQRFDQYDTDRDKSLDSNELLRMAEDMLARMGGPERERRGGPREGRGPGRGGRLMQLDTNQDGKLTASELEWVPPFFRQGILRMDTNSDGTIDEEELQRGMDAFRARRGGSRGGPRERAPGAGRRGPGGPRG